MKKVVPLYLYEESGSLPNDRKTGTGLKGDKLVRIIRPVMIPKEINTRRNVAAALFGEKLGESIVDKMIYKSPSLRLISGFTFISGFVAAILSFFNVFPPYISILGGIATFITVISNAYIILISELVWMLLTRFDTW